MQVAARVVKRLRWARGWTVQELSAAANVSDKTISRIENDMSIAPRPKTNKRIADALGVTVADIMLDDVGDMGAVGRGISE